MQILAGIILLGVLVTFHELGHFLFAKWLGVRVLVFSVGFGPKIWGFKKGETEYRLSAIPLGGYVRMFGESLEENFTPEEKKMSFMHQAIWRKSLIAVAGPLFNFILPVILLFFLLVGTEKVFAPRVGTLVENGVAEKAGIKPHDLITEVKGKKVTSFNEVAEMIAAHPNQDLPLTIEREEQGASHTIHLTVRPEPKSLANPLEKAQSVGRIGIMPAVELPVVIVSESSPFKGAGLRSFDEIKKIDGIKIESKADLYRALAHLKPGSSIEALRNPHHEREGTIIRVITPLNFRAHLEPHPIKNAGTISQAHKTEELAAQSAQTKTLLERERADFEKNHGILSANGAVTEVASGSIAASLGIELEDCIIAIDGERVVNSMQLQQAILQNPHVPHTLGVLKNNGASLIAEFLLPDGEADRVGLNTDLMSLLGIKTAQVFKAGELIERQVGVVEAFKRASLQTWDIIAMTGKSFWLLVKREVPATQLGGPLMLFDVAQQAAEKGLAYYIFIMCLLSVNLGLLNLLPIPVLDGGHLLLFGIEAVQRKPLTAKTRAIATQIGIVILLMIMAFAIFNDISRLFRG